MELIASKYNAGGNMNKGSSKYKNSHKNRGITENGQSIEARA